MMAANRIKTSDAMTSTNGMMVEYLKNRNDPQNESFLRVMNCLRPLSEDISKAYSRSD